MHPRLKGLLVGIANLLAVAVVIGLREDPADLAGIVLVIAVMGGAPAIGVGVLCGSIAGRFSAFRRSSLIAVSVAAVAGLGIVSEPALIAPALPSTILGALALEWWTREDLAKQAAPMTPAAIGAALGLANVIVVACVLAVYVKLAAPLHLQIGVRGASEVGWLVLAGGALPGALLGALAGQLAAWLGRRPERVRVAVLAGAGAAGVLVLGALSDSPHLVGPALLPTLGAVIVLERRTRAIELVPGARVHRAA